MTRELEAMAPEAWRLVHDMGLPIKKAAANLGVAISEAYELLALWKARLEASEARRLGLGALRTGRNAPAASHDVTFVPAHGEAGRRQ